MDRKRKIILSASIIAIAAGAGQLVQSNIGGADRQAAAAPTGVVMLSAKAGPAAEVPAPMPVAASATPALPKPAPDAAVAKAAPAPAKADPAPVVAAAGDPAPAIPAPKPVLAAVDPDAAPARPPVAQAPAAAPVPQAVTPAAPVAPTVTAAAEPVTAPPAAEAPKAPEPVAVDTCQATLTATAMPGAVLSVGLVAPCDGEARVVLRHGGLAVTGKLSPAGTLFTTLPAMEPGGEVTALFPDGTRATAATGVDLTGIRRLAVQWQGDDAFQLQIYENGAAYGAPGNLSAERPVGEGRVDVLGDASVDLPLLAQVYTWPVAPIPVEVTVEAAVTEATCNREILGEAVETVAGRVTTTEIALAMPDCGGVGDFLVLNNLAGQTTLAAAE